MEKKLKPLHIYVYHMAHVPRFSGKLRNNVCNVIDGFGMLARFHPNVNHTNVISEGSPLKCQNDEANDIIRDQQTAKKVINYIL